MNENNETNQTPNEEEDEVVETPQRGRGAANSGRKLDAWDAALVMAERHGNTLIYSEREKCFRRWARTHWVDVVDERGEIDPQAVEAVRSVNLQASSREVNDTLRFAKNTMRREFVSREDIVNFKNGSLEIERTDIDGHVCWSIGAFRSEHRAEDYQTSVLPYNYNPDGSHPNITKFMDESIRDPRARQCVMIQIGAALIHDTMFQYVPVIQGPSGSGKSVLLTLVTMMVHEASTEAEIKSYWSPGNLFNDDLEAKRVRFARRDRAIICIDEFPKSALDGEEVFKTAIQHGAVPMRGMNKNDDTKTPWRAKVFMATNSILRIRDNSGAIARRLVPVRMTRVRGEGERDIVLWERFRDELGAFAVTCIEAAIEARNLGYMPMSRGMKATVALWSKAGNNLRSFVEDYCVVGSPDEYRVPIGRIFERYKMRISDSDSRNKSEQNMVSDLLEMYPHIFSKKGRYTFLKNGVKEKVANAVWCLYGITLKADLGIFDDDTDDDVVSAEDDFRLAVDANRKLIAEADALARAGKRDEAYKILLDITDEIDREFYTKRLERTGTVLDTRLSVVKQEVEDEQTTQILQFTPQVVSFEDPDTTNKRMAEFYFRNEPSKAMEFVNKIKDPEVRRELLERQTRGIARAA